MKDSKFVASRADLGSIFHRKGAATWKALSPIVFLVFALGLSKKRPLSLRLKL